MKVFFWFFLITTVLSVLSLIIYIPRNRLPKSSWLLIIPMFLITAGSGYLSWLQYDYNRNMEAIEDYFRMNCKGFAMKPLEDPIEVLACGNTYHVKANNGRIVMMEIVSSESIK
jgi:hypothetical protein